jgi:hypothetical protein
MCRPALRAPAASTTYQAEDAVLQQPDDGHRCHRRDRRHRDVVPGGRQPAALPTSTTWM